MSSDETISRLLVECGGYRDLETPVILTSGELGIYYVNTEKLLGDDGEFAKYGGNSAAMLKYAMLMAEQNPIFDNVIKILTTHTLIHLPMDVPADQMLISGGQRRDWLFSGPVANRLGLMHLSLYKDGRMRIVNPGDNNEEAIHPDDNPLDGIYVVHISDLLTKGSSAYNLRNNPPTGWVPMIRNAAGTIESLLTTVTRLQGGEKLLESMNVAVASFVQIDETFIREHSAQPDVALQYIRDPTSWSERYICEQGIDAFVDAFNPEGRNVERAQKFLLKYAAVLRSSGRGEELKSKVSDKYGIALNLL